MYATKKKRLEAAGFSVGGTQEFLDLTDEEMAYIENKRSSIQHLGEKRTAQKLPPTIREQIRYKRDD